MQRPVKSVSLGSLLCFFALYPVLISGTYKKVTDKNTITEPTSEVVVAIAAPVPPVVKSAKELLQEETDALYDSISGKRFGLSKQAFAYAYKGYKLLLDNNKLANNDVLTICDFSQSSRRKRLFVIDVTNKKILLHTWVAHGRNSGGEYARSFSNSAESHKSSLGFYVTHKTYIGENGLSLKLKGLEKGVNDKAVERNIVMHGSDYIGSGYLRSHRVNGRSYGCPAIPEKDTKEVIHTIKGGSCLFIYHPTKHYLTNSKILNG